MKGKLPNYIAFPLSPDDSISSDACQASVYAYRLLTSADMFRRLASISAVVYGISLVPFLNTLWVHPTDLCKPLVAGAGAAPLAQQLTVPGPSTWKLNNEAPLLIRIHIGA